MKPREFKSTLAKISENKPIRSVPQRISKRSLSDSSRELGRSLDSSHIENVIDEKILEDNLEQTSSGRYPWQRNIAVQCDFTACLNLFRLPGSFDSEESDDLLELSEQPHPSSSSFKNLETTASKLAIKMRAKEKRRKCFVRKHTQSEPSLFANCRVPRLLPCTAVDGEDEQNLTNQLELLIRHGTADMNEESMLLSPAGRPSPSPSPLPWQPHDLNNSGYHQTKTDEEDTSIQCFLLPPSPKQRKGHEALSGDESDQEQVPPASALTRRRALIPPKLLSDDYDNSLEDLESSISVPSFKESTGLPMRRRSSIVVIPPMQICPGDLLVYSKVLTKRNTLTDLNGSTQSLPSSDDNRKTKSSWSLLKLFERTHRGKSDSLTGLEECLSTIKPIEFVDDQLKKYKDVHWSEVFTDTSVDSEVFQVLSESEIKRREAVWELFQCECIFLYDHLMVLKNVFMEPLKKVQVEGYLMFAEPEVLFGNLDELCCVSYAFCKEFINLLLSKMNASEFGNTEVLVQLFEKRSRQNISPSQAYQRYCLNYINALNYLENLRKQDDFCEFEKWCSQDTRCNRLQLTDLLVSPVQHTTKLPLLLKEICKRTLDEKEREQLMGIHEQMENALRELDDKMKWLKNFERLQYIQKLLIWPSVQDLDPKAFVPEFLKPSLTKQPCERIVCSPKRQIVHEGTLCMFEGGKITEMQIFLFDDMILLTRLRKGLSKKDFLLSCVNSVPCDTCLYQKSSLSETNLHSSRNTVVDAGTRYLVHRQPLPLDRLVVHDVSHHEATVSNMRNAFVWIHVNRYQQVVGIYTMQAPNQSTKIVWMTKVRESVDKYKQNMKLS